MRRWSGGRYLPDFIVIDATGVHWLVEAKSDEEARDSADVAAKAASAREWVDRVNESKQFDRWRYLLVTETGLKNAANWEAPLAATG